MSPTVEVRDLVVDRGRVRVLDGLDLDLAPGVTGLLGPSGCGKSTLLRSDRGGPADRRRDGAGARARGREPCGARPGGLRDPGRQRVRRPHRRRERPLLRPGPRGERRRGRARPWTLVDLAPLGDRVVGALSGGQRSRVSLAVALLGGPDVLVLDEPTVGLDPVLRRDLWELFARLAGAGATVLVSSHVMDEADRCERLLLMREGAVIADGSPASIRQRTGTEDVESAFLALVEPDGPGTAGCGPRHPAHHPRHRGAGADPAAPRPPHPGPPAGAAARPDGAAVVDVRRLVPAGLRPDRARTPRALPVLRDVPGHQRHHPARALQRHPGATARPADRAPGLPAGLRDRVRGGGGGAVGARGDGEPGDPGPRRRRPGVAAGGGGRGGRRARHGARVSS